MKLEDINTWYESLIERANQLRFQNHTSGTRWYDDLPARVWITEAETAIAAVFRDGHPVRATWLRLNAKSEQEPIGVLCGEYIAILLGAYNLTKGNRLASLIDSIRQESEDELLDQAAALLKDDYLAAAAVIAGGALETHLRHYVNKHGITISDSGSISSYNDAVSREARKGANLYDKNDAKQVTAWGGIRNEAAHKPGEFKRTKERIDLMIQGIRQFIAHTA
jgi:hypothetical protein